MPRTRGGFKTRQRRKRVLKLAKGYRGAKSKLFRTATEAVDKALGYAYRDRRNRKREFRKLWITRINAAADTHNLSYSRMIHGLKELNISLNRKILADMAVNDPSGFARLAKMAKERVAAPA